MLLSQTTTTAAARQNHGTDIHKQRGLDDQLTHLGANLARKPLKELRIYESPPPDPASQSQMCVCVERERERRERERERERGAFDGPGEEEENEAGAKKQLLGTEMCARSSSPSYSLIGANGPPIEEERRGDFSSGKFNLWPNKGAFLCNVA